MLIYALIGLSLVLVGIAGLQFTYLFYVDRLYREQKKYLQEIEQKCAHLAKRLEAAERRVAEQDAMLETIQAESGNEDEVWSDVID